MRGKKSNANDITWNLNERHDVTDVRKGKKKLSTYEASFIDHPVKFRKRLKEYYLVHYQQIFDNFFRRWMMIER
jgi:hypothetical protein